MPAQAMTRSSSHLILVARFPSPGKCKTRLIPRLGAEGACAFALAALSDLLHLYASLSLQKTLIYTPESAREEIEEFLRRAGLQGSWNIHPQIASPDLGGRLRGALEYAQGLCKDQDGNLQAGSVTFIGMDCFDLDPARIEQSATLATLSKARILPARDGGYVLLSVPSSCQNTIFDRIPWSSSQTCAAQIERLVETGLECDVGETLDDVDEPEDLDRLWQARGDKLTAYPRITKFLGAVMSADS